MCQYVSSVLLDFKVKTGKPIFGHFMTLLHTLKGVISPHCWVPVFYTSLDGFRRTSPTPPPLLRPWLSTVTMHMSKESHVRSLSSITTADGWIAREATKTQQSVTVGSFKVYSAFLSSSKNTFIYGFNKISGYLT